MSIELPKIKIIISEEKREKKKEQLSAREKLKKEIRKSVAWGFITLSALGAAKFLFREKPKEGVSIDEIISAHIDKDKTIKEAEKQELLNKIDYLKKQFGDLNLERLVRFSEINRDVKPKNPEIKNFDKLHPKLNDEILKTIWNEEYYPKGWINERVSAIEYAEKGELPERYGIDPKKQEATAEYRAPEVKKAKITIFKATGSLAKDTSVGKVITALNSVFNHELGHANDWVEEDLKFKNRIEFLYETTQQYFKKESMKNDYVESIKNEDPQIERYCKIGEYWAEICNCYFSWPEAFERAYPDEFALADKYVQKEDPNFNITEKTNQKVAAIRNIIKEK